LSSGSISKRTPQVSGKDLKALAGAVPTRMNTVLLSTFLDNQSPFLSCIVQTILSILLHVPKLPPDNQK
jgi:hypothetical protein